MSSGGREPSPQDDAEDWGAAGAGPSVPNVARMYDWYLGGKDNFAVDREAGRGASAVFPDLPRVARSNRDFLVRAVRYLAESGITQFVDVGTGIPTSPNVHEVARTVHPDARVVYVDNDPVVVAHNRALRATVPGVVALEHDLRDAAAILSDPRLRDTVDLDRPVAVLFVAVLHFVDHTTSKTAVKCFREAMAPGSQMAVSVLCGDGTDRARLSALQAIYAGTTAPAVVRDRGQIEELFDGFELVEPGLVDLPRWRGDGAAGSVRGLCGVGSRP